MEKLVRWNVDLSNEITSSVYLIKTSSGNQAYLSARSMKIRKKGSKDWMKPRQKIFKADDKRFSKCARHINVA